MRHRNMRSNSYSTIWAKSGVGRDRHLLTSGARHDLRKPWAELLRTHSFLCHFFADQASWKSSALLHTPSPADSVPVHRLRGISWASRMIRGTLMTSACRQHSRVTERVRLRKEVRVLYGQDKAEPPRRQSYVNRAGLEWLVCLDYS